jgi:hypothetical protein
VDNPDMESKPAKPENLGVRIKNHLLSCFLVIKWAFFLIAAAVRQGF